MLTVKEINEVSFGKAGFSGYKPEDVDNFIDEVVESFTQLEAERDEAVEQSTRLMKQADGLNRQIAELKSKNAELQKKLGILAQKIESYREEEDGIKEAILSAQRMAKDAVQEARDKAAIMLEDAKADAGRILANARDDAAKAAQEYAGQVEGKKHELEEMKRQVSAFRVSLLEMYKKHLESINHIPNFRVKDPAPAAAPVQPEPLVEKEPQPVPAKEAPKAEPKEEPVPAPAPVEEPAPEAVTEPAAPQAPEQTTLEDSGLHNKVDFSQEQERPSGFEDDLSQVGIDLRAYSSIPESLQREKESHFSHLEFGDDVDVGARKRRKR